MTEQHLTSLTDGLTAAAVQARIKAGQKNDPLPPLTRSTKQIFRDNLLTLFNLVNVILGGLVFITGSYKNLLFLGVILMNTAIGIFQELRSKRQVDKLALLSAAKINIRRDGQVTAHDQADIVQDDVLQVTRGDQLPVDGLVRQTTGLEVDESQITGEAEPVIKGPGEAIISGSVILGGHGLIQATAVGHGSFIKKLARSAKSNRRTTSQLLTIINRIIKILTFTIIPLGAALFMSMLLRGESQSRAILGTVAAMVGMIPEGLVLLTSVALAAGAFTLGRHQVLVRELPAIEALARVDVLCLDKTGTITSGHLKFDRLAPWHGTDDTTIKTILAKLVQAINDDNETAQALHTALGPAEVKATQVYPFSSSRKWSGASFDEQAYVMGAPEFIFKTVPTDLAAEIQQLAQQGYRVLVLAQVAQLTTPKPTEPVALGLILITDELRPHAKNTFG